MLHVFQILILVGLHFMLARCLIPDLNVQMLDKRLIQRKRQDTLDMCRIFTAETDKLNTLSEAKPPQSKARRRIKRETGVKLTNTELENAKRVESIVDKLYEDLEENGERVTYMKRKLDTTTTVSDKDLKNETRRSNFAPAKLSGPLPKSQGPAGHGDADGQPGGIDWHKRWKHGIVPYFIDSKTYDTQLAEVIMKAFDYFEKATCIRLQRLKDRPTDRESLQNVEWLYITNPSGIRQCVHSNERKANQGVQMVVFGYDCMSLGEIVHEVMHILGFSHEHTRPDRDQHITILWNNIKPGYKKYFETRASDPLLNIPYDYSSVLHYPPRAFSKNGQFTIVTQPGTKLGQREGLSDGDVEKVGVVFGNECVERNRQYLLKTCPSVVRADTRTHNVTQQEIMEYFRDRIWPYGVVNYKFRDLMEFSSEERENIKAVIRHIQKETCIIFRDISDENDDDVNQYNGKASQYPNEGELSAGVSSDANVNPVKFLNPAENTEVETTTAGLSEENFPPYTVDNAGDVESVGILAGNNGQSAVNDLNPHQSDVENEISRKSDDELNETVLRKGTNINATNTSKTSEAVKQKPARKKAGPRTNRRHATDILVLKRAMEPGCICPTPGKPNGNKVLNINADCFNSVNDLLHLFVHLLGLDHQHNMHDRDFYLHILWDNLTPEIREEMKEKLPPAASLGYDYDYQSVMHYPWLQIKNGVTNIMYPIWNDGWAMGHWQGLSSTDVFKLNLLYFEQCLERKKQTEAV